MIVVEGDNPALRLKQAELGDIEDLRIWKNAQRQWFFYKAEITPAQQEVWFFKHQQRKHDVLFLVQEKNGDEFWKNVGSLGYRLTSEGVIDLYNIMRGQRLSGSSVSLGDAFDLLLTYLWQTYKLPIVCDVLSQNPARTWYQKHGMAVLEERDEPEPHVVYGYSGEGQKFSPVRIIYT